MNSRSEHPRGRIVIARTNRGLERGEVLCEATDRVIAQMSDPLNGSIQRDATPADEHEYQQIQKSQERDFGVCKTLIKESVCR